MKNSPGRPKWKAPDAHSLGRPGQTSSANLAPRLGQKTKSPYKRFLMGQKSKYTQQAPNYAVGRTRRMA